MDVTKAFSCDEQCLAYLEQMRWPMACDAWGARRRSWNKIALVSPIITDNRTAKTYTLPIENGTIRAMGLRQIKAGPDDFGLMTYDPAFMNTASCQSSITFIDGEGGILRYHGYPIEALAEHCSFLEVAYLLLVGELPDETELQDWVKEITLHTMLHESTKKFMEGFRYDAILWPCW